MGTETVDLDAMSLEQIKKLANDEAAKAVADALREAPAEDEAQPEDDQPAPARDEKGRFTKLGAEEVDDEAPKPSFRREIDLGDGSGKQVFEGDSMEDLVDQLATAQRHATQKIHQQAQELRKIEEAKAQANSDDEYVVSQRLQAKPKETVTEIVKAELEADRKRNAEAQRLQREAYEEQSRASEQFITDNPDYVKNPKNAQLMTDKIELLGLRARGQGKNYDYATLLTKAFSELKSGGLLEIKSDEANAVTEHSGSDTPRIVESEETVTPQRRKASGLTSRARVTTPLKNTQPTEEDLYALTLEQLKEGDIRFRSQR